MMSDAEKAVMRMTADLWNACLKLGDHAAHDLRELERDIHDIQHRIMARVARRQNPDLFR